MSAVVAMNEETRRMEQFNDIGIRNLCYESVEKSMDCASKWQEEKYIGFYQRN